MIDQRWAIFETGDIPESQSLSPNRFSQEDTKGAFEKLESGISPTTHDQSHAGGSSWASIQARESVQPITLALLSADLRPRDFAGASCKIQGLALSGRERQESI